jgi:hypothetical protein
MDATPHPLKGQESLRRDPNRPGRVTNRTGCQRTTTDIDGQLQQAGRPTPQDDVVQTWLGTARSPTSAYRRNGSRTAGVTGRNGGRARIAHPLTVRSQIHADLCTDLAGHVGKQTSGLCRPVLFGAQNATICAPKLVITEELPATHIGYLKSISDKPWL